MFDLSHHLTQPARNPAATIPRIDLGECLSHDPENSQWINEAACLRAGQQICEAMYHVGFFTLINHGVCASTLSKAFTQSQKLFELPLDAKKAIAYTTTDVNRGYIGKLHETLEGTGTSKLRYAGVAPNVLPDVKESFDVPSPLDNEWPQVLPAALMPEFTNQIYPLRNELDRVHRQIMEAIAVSIKLPSNYFADFFRQEQYSLRLLHYPQTPASQISDSGQKRAGTHTDYNQMTLLLQQDIGGLQLLNSADQWIDVTPEPGAIVVNTGDLMERWSNGLFRSTVHRVVQPEQAGETLPSRYSMAYFVKPDRTALIECLPTCQTDTYPAQFEPVNCLDYVDAAFKKAGNENVAERVDVDENPA